MWDFFWNKSSVPNKSAQKKQNKQKPPEAITYHFFSSVHWYLLPDLDLIEMYCYLKFFSFKYFISQAPVKRQKSPQLSHQREFNTLQNW